MAVRDGVRSIARTLQRPGEGYHATVARARAAAATASGEAARQLDVFAGRVGDLSLAELRELHDETFAAPSIAVVGTIAARLARPDTSLSEARAAVDVLAPALVRLDADCNPFSYVVKALCCVLLTPSHHEELPCPGSPTASVPPSPR